jgi:ADP-heptose:LPS heptosyltransferase
MRPIQHIGVFYSRGPHFRRALKHVRGAYPEASITALVPPAYPAESIAGLANKVVVTVRAERTLSTFLSIIGQIRSNRYDLLVTMFDSPRLRVLSHLSRARFRYCFTPDGRYFAQGDPIPSESPDKDKLRTVNRSLIRSLVTSLKAQLFGWILYHYIRYIVRHRPVDKS